MLGETSGNSTTISNIGSNSLTTGNRFLYPSINNDLDYVGTISIPVSYKYCNDGDGDTEPPLYWTANSNFVRDNPLSDKFTFDECGSPPYDKELETASIGEKTEIWFYPNPTSYFGWLEILKSNDELSYAVSISDITGKVLQEYSIGIGQNRVGVNTEKLKPGIYIVFVYFDKLFIGGCKFIKI